MAEIHVAELRVAIRKAIRELAAAKKEPSNAAIYQQVTAGYPRKVSDADVEMRAKGLRKLISEVSGTPGKAGDPDQAEMFPDLHFLRTTNRLVGKDGRWHSLVPEQVRIIDLKRTRDSEKERKAESTSHDRDEFLAAAEAAGLSDRMLVTKAAAKLHKEPNV